MKSVTYWFERDKWNNSQLYFYKEIDGKMIGDIVSIPESVFKEIMIQYIKETSGEACLVSGTLELATNNCD